MSVRQKDDPALYEKIQEQNLLRQYDLLTNCIEIGLCKGIEAFDKYTLWALNYAAVANLAQFGGRYREDPIYVGSHKPPHFKDVPNEMDRFFSIIHENWTIGEHPTMLPAYALWRLNWIHPFVEGNGRTARAACYYLMCMRQGKLLPGKKIVPERIRENRMPYVDGLRAADAAWEMGDYDVSSLAVYLEQLLTGISVLAPNSLTLYPPLGTPAHKYFLWPDPGLGTESRRCQCKPLTAGRGLPISFCQTPLRPLLALDRFSGSHTLGHPAGSDSPPIRRSILPNNRFARWLSAKSSQ